MYCLCAHLATVCVLTLLLYCTVVCSTCLAGRLACAAPLRQAGAQGSSSSSSGADHAAAAGHGAAADRRASLAPDHAHQAATGMTLRGVMELAAHRAPLALGEGLLVVAIPRSSSSASGAGATAAATAAAEAAAGAAGGGTTAAATAAAAAEATAHVAHATAALQQLAVADLLLLLLLAARRWLRRSLRALRR
jgi:hypothetical protein